MTETTRHAAPAALPATEEKPSFFSRFTVGGPLLGLIILCVVFSLTTDVFLSARNFLNILDQVTVLGILSIGMTVVIVTAGIDLSVGSILAFSMMMMGWLYEAHGIPFVIAIFMSLITGAVCGLVNGLLVTRAKLPPFIATLAMMTIARGLANILTGGRQVVGMPDWFTSLSIVRHFGFLSATVALFIILLIVAGVILRYRSVGRSFYAIGGSAEVARLAGIRVRQLTTSVYVVAGTLSAVAGIAMASRLDSCQPSAGLGYELDTIAAVVIGGASLNGGVGGIGGTLVGVLIIGVLRNGLNLMAVSPFVQQIIIGVVIAIAVTADTLRHRD